MVLNDLAPGVLIFLAALTAWLVILTIWLFRTVRHYSKLTSKTGVTNLKSILEKLLQSQDEVLKHSQALEEALKELDKKTGKHIQKVGLVRFNPFAETGGDQSFALALLNEEDTGVVLLSLHGREGTRIYVKPVKQAKSRYELSKEEQQAIEEARKQK